MSKNFNLLLLHMLEDIHPRTWICLKGPKIYNIIKHIEKEVCRNNNWSKRRLSLLISNQLECHHNTIYHLFQNKYEFYPIPVILELLKFNKHKQKFLKEVKNNITYLKVNSASSKPVKGVNKLNKNLAKILGAFMADGSLSIQKVIASPQSKDLREIENKLKKLKIHYSTGVSPSRNQYYVSIQMNRNNFKKLNKLNRSFLTQTHYNIELSDEYEDNVEAFIKWIKEEFNIHPNRFKQKKGAWRVTFSNKILARYLMRFFEVKPGPKTYYAHEPKIIKRSGLQLRKAFAKGVLMFDGCVSQQRKILFSTKSCNLFNSIKEIWRKDKINFGESLSQRRKEWNLFTTVSNTKGNLLKYFEPYTQKWKLINWLSGDINSIPILKTKFSLSTEKILKVLKEIERCDVLFLKNYFKCSHSTIRSYLKILKNQSKIKLSDAPTRINDYIDKNTTVLLKNRFHKLLFKRIKEKFKKDKNFAGFLEVQKGTLSAWKVRKNRIPIYVLKKMCKLLDIDCKQASRNIRRTDREIIEII